MHNSCQRMSLLANKHVVIYESPDPTSIYAYTPGILRLASGRLLATMDLGGPGVSKLPGPTAFRWESHSQGKVFTSDDSGLTWTHRIDFPFLHARPFIAGKSIYVLGHAEDLYLIKSDDGGVSFTPPVQLTQGEYWHGSACNVWRAHGRIYLVMMKRPGKARKELYAHLAPVVLSAAETDDLCQAKVWRYSNAISFNQLLPASFGLGVPFHKPGPTAPNNPGDTRPMPVPGWHEAAIVQFPDPRHVWHDPLGRTFYIWLRAFTGLTNMAAIACAREDDAGQISVDAALAPSGEPVLYVPCPGGHMKFYILYDETSGTFWLLSSQTTDSMTYPAALPADRFNLPDNERHRLALWYSINCMDWCMAGMVAIGGSPRESRHYAAMDIDGDDLVIASRSGNAHARNAHDGNLITFHRVENFRQLIY